MNIREAVAADQFGDVFVNNRLGLHRSQPTTQIEHYDHLAALCDGLKRINDADVKQARANHVLARNKYERALDLQKQNFISAQARDEAENNLKVAEAAVVGVPLVRGSCRGAAGG